MSDEQFESHIAKAISSLPKQFREKLNNVAIVIEQYPSDAHLKSVKMKRGSGLLLGLYQGIALPRRGAGYGIGGTLPDKISIFKNSILAIARSEEEIDSIIYDTVLHEIAHHFGMDEDQVRNAERQKRSSTIDL